MGLVLRSGLVVVSVGVLFTGVGCQTSGPDDGYSEAVFPPPPVFAEPATPSAYSVPGAAGGGGGEAVFTTPGAARPSGGGSAGAAFGVPLFDPGPGAGLGQPGGTYVVRKGDTLWSIAARVYNDGQRYRDVLAANPGIDASRLSIGQELVLP